MSDWTTFSIEIPASTQEVGRIECSNLWNEGYEAPLDRMVQYLGASPRYSDGTSGTKVRYYEGALRGLITIRYGTAEEAFKFLGNIELVLGRQVENIHLTGYYDGNSSFEESVHWRCGCPWPVESPLFNPALWVNKGKRRDGLEMKLVHPKISEDGLRKFAQNFSREDRVARVLDGQLVVNWAEPSPQYDRLDIKQFGLDSWNYTGGKFYRREGSSWYSSAQAGLGRAMEMIMPVAITT